MKHTLLTLTLALLPLAAAEPLTPSPTAPAQSQRRAAEYACMALTRPLPGGGSCTIAGAGEVMRSVPSLHRGLPGAVVGEPAPIPENRVTRVLNCPEATALPSDWYDDKYAALWKDDSPIPADRVRELWYAALESLSVPVSWFCDAAGDNLVIVTGHAANFYSYTMYLYQWDDARQAFIRRGCYYFGSRYGVLIPSRVEFRPEGMLISAVLFLEEPREFRHLYLYSGENASVSFPEQTPERLQKL